MKWSLSVRLFRQLLAGQLLMTVLVIFIAAAALLIAATEYFQTRLQHDRDLLIQELHWDDGKLDIHQDVLPPIFVTPLSGHYFQLDWHGQVISSPSLQNLNLPGPAQPEEHGEHWSWRSSELDEHLYVLTQTLTIKGQEVELRIAEDMLPVVSLFGQAFLKLMLFLLAAMWAVFAWQRRHMRQVLLPFSTISEELRRLGQQEIERLNTPDMKELAPLVNEVNQLGDRMQERLVRARLASGNLSHSLKTPLAILNNRLDELDGDTETLLEAKAQIQRINQLIDNEMKRARIAGLMSQADRLDLHGLLQELIASMIKLYPGVDIRLSEAAMPGYPGDREDMFELLGNLLDNACKWANHRIHVTLTHADGDLIIRIEDDGPGVPEPQLDGLHRPGLRLDEQTSGYGLGLAIVADIISQYQGDLRFRNGSCLGGLEVEVRLPR